MLLRHAYGDANWRFTDSLPQTTNARWRGWQGFGACDMFCICI